MVLVLAQRTATVNLTPLQLRIRHYTSFIVPFVAMTVATQTLGPVALVQYGSILFMLGVVLTLCMALYNDWVEAMVPGRDPTAQRR